MVLKLPADLAEVARKELNETDEKREQMLQELRIRLEKLPKEQQPHRLDDDYLVAFLRGTKYRIDVAEKKVTNMAKFMRDNAEYTKDLRAEEFKDFYGQGFMRILNGRDKQGRAITCLLPAKMGEIKDATLFVRWNFWCMTELLKDPYLQVNGFVMIESFEGFSLINALRMQSIPRHIMNKCFKMQQECMPFRLKGIFVVNQPAYMSFLWALVRPFMSSKLRARVHFIGRRVEAFHAFIDSELLPPEFGGTLQEAPSAWLDACIARERAQAGALGGAVSADEVMLRPAK